MDLVIQENKPKKKVEKRSIEARRQQVLAIVTHLLHSDQGMERITTAKLAEAVGVSEAALYRYFPSKTKIFEALIEQIETVLLQRITQSMKMQTDTKLRVHDILQMVLTFAQKNPGLTRILTGHALMFEDKSLQMRVATFFDRLELQLVNVLQMRKLREGRGFKMDERAIAGYLVLLCEGQFMRYVRSNFRHLSSQDFETQWKLVESIFD
ncbi:division inhibitor protein [Gallibacterium genomosp. 2]|uniref:Nucleoid occlusion factor SlmA n=2 Tax=Gallibacterium TaxID=155493 RepID=A0A0A2Y226_9PAST|nr:MULTISPECIES: nucleoid occlusion factor SlmA [Gallibacterium]KGQ34223.1 division inhibitor protein [Gallibacterium genomosp. 2]KGQ37162.1 division inhibitor protein [Gallibacterium genomosp. 1]OBX00166.1 division inhibitor protein [Gallibacterium genomosp. 1]OBX02347.1 division inhibitor protein [Gallibacterium genomosp. 1]